MLLRLACLVVLTVASSLVLAGSPVPSDEKLLKDHKIATDGPGLLAYLEARAGDVVSDAKLKALVEQLGDDAFEKREEASKQLDRAGLLARGVLLEALKDRDLEIRHRAARCLERIHKDIAAESKLICAAVRLVSDRKPRRATRVLLDYLSKIGEGAISEEIRHALAALAVRDGKADADLVSALADKQASKRGTAALALCQAKANDQLPAIRKLLDDESESVRLPVALALARLGEKAAVPVLIALMDRTPSRKTGVAEDILFHLAGQKSPHLPAADANALKKYRGEWEAWWKDNKENVDLAVLHEAAREPGHTTVVLLDEGQILDLDRDGKARWTIEKIAKPLDIQRLPGEKVLLAEYEGNRVTERNSKGEVIWERKFPEPIVAQRLPNGNTFLANNNLALEVTRAGKEVFRYTPAYGQEIFRARKLPGGEILMVTKIGTTHFVRLDRFGNEIKRFGVEVSTQGGRIDLTPAGNVLIPEMNNDRVQERDLDGKIIREISIPQPITAFSLSNGHVLVTSMTQARAVEIDRAGKEVWQYKRDTRVTRAVRP